MVNGKRRFVFKFLSLVMVMVLVATGCGKQKEENTTFKVSGDGGVETVSVELYDSRYVLNRDGSMFTLTDNDGKVYTHGYFSDKMSYDEYKAAAKSNPNYEELTIKDNEGFFVQEGSGKWVYVLAIQNTGTCAILTNTVSFESAEEIAYSLDFVVEEGE